MISLLGIGNTGINIINKLSSYQKFNLLEIDEDKNVKKQKTPEDYENNCPAFKKLFSNVNEDIYVFLSAAGNISGLLLKTLEQLKAKNIYLTLFLTDDSMLPKISRLQQKIVFNVMQEYARSGLIAKLYIINNSNLEKLLDEVSLDQYYDKLNEAFCYTFYNIMYLKNLKPLFEVKQELTEIDRISTIGLYDKNNNKNLFYNLSNIKKEQYYYSFSKEEISKNGKVLQEIKKNLLSEEGDILKTFSIYEINEANNYAFIESTTHIIQETQKQIQAT